MEKVIGIDLGTTNSAVAIVDPFTGKGECVLNKEGFTLTASAVCFQNREEPMIGNIARDCKVLYPDTTATLFKRLMGVEKTAITVDKTAYSPQQLSALVLKSLKADAEEELGEKIEKVVITVPAYFDSNRRQATIESGQEAGFEVLDLLDEPVAALYAADSIKNYAGKTVLIFDLGGGTLDIVCAKITEDRVEELVINGDIYCGGSDWLKAFIAYIKATSLKGVELDIEGEQELANKTEQAKIALSKKEKTNFTVMTKKGRKEITVTQKEFENCTMALLTKAMRVLEETKETLEEKGVFKIDQIILCGGATRMPQITKGIREIYPDVSIYEKDQDQAVAKGAAIYAKALLSEEQLKVNKGAFSASKKADGSDVKIKKLHRVTGRSYGVAAYVGDHERKVCNMIMQNEELPVSKEKVFYTKYDNQRQVSLEVFESTESNRYEEITDASAIGKCCLEIKGDIPKYSPIIVNIRLEENGTLCVYGHEESGDTEVSARMETQALLSPGELKAERTQVEEVFVKVG
jgi:molecular chaperone DnaK (HSP70)